MQESGADRYNKGELVLVSGPARGERCGQKNKTVGNKLSWIIKSGQRCTTLGINLSRGPEFLLKPLVQQTKL